MLHYHTLDKSASNLLIRFQEDEKTEHFSLAGGASIALQLGHRKTNDLDFFISERFDPVALLEHLQTNYHIDHGMFLSGSTWCISEGTRLCFIHADYPKSQPVARIEGIKMMHPIDIGAIKLRRIAHDNGQQNDFIDLYCLLEKYTMHDLLKAYESKYNDSIIIRAKLEYHYHPQQERFGQTQLIARAVSFPEVMSRINKAALEPWKIFAPADKRSEGKRKGIEI